MIINKLVINNFRNIAQAELAPNGNFTVFWGNNAQGKTNLLEALYYLGHWKSFRSSRNEELIRHGASSFIIVAELSRQQTRHTIGMELSAAGRHVRLDGKDVKNISQFIGLIRPVLFAPEEVNLVKGVPAGRRALLDRAIFQAEPSFLQRAQNYRRILQQRNRLLKEEASQKQLIPWTEGLIEAGARLRLDRQRYLQRILPLFREAYNQISGGQEQAEIEYPVPEAEIDDHRQQLQTELAAAEEREYRLGQSLIGPHRDDPLFLVDDLPLRLYGSQGQQRSFLLAFKTAQIIDLETTTGETPLLLLDDMTSELDRSRQGFFFRFLMERKGQVFITTTDIAPLKKEGLGDALFFHVEQGRLEPSICE